MGSQDQHRSTDLFGAIEADRMAKQQAHEQATAPEREAREKQAAADVKLMNTPAWDTIGDHRRRHATALVARQADTGQAGNATQLAADLARAQA